jgi:hypothetical protein
MKEVVRTKILKLLEAGIIYPIADSRWCRRYALEEMVNAIDYLTVHN